MTPRRDNRASLMTTSKHHSLPNIHSLKVPHEILAIAMEWQVTLWSGEVTAEEQMAFDYWLQADPMHPLAWQQVQLVNQQLEDIPGQLGGHVLRQTAVV